jgi:hypothetical protein
LAMSSKIDAKKEKRLRNEEYARKHRRRRSKRQRKTLAELNQCHVPGHPETCTFDSCPAYNRLASVAQSG